MAYNRKPFLEFYGEFALSIIVGAQSPFYPSQFYTIPMYEPNLIGNLLTVFRVRYNLVYVVPNEGWNVSDYNILATTCGEAQKVGHCLIFPFLCK